MKRDRITKILERHGSMRLPALVASIDRSPQARDRRVIRKFLKTRRKQATAEEETAIWYALFAYYGIPEEWPEETRYYWLAGRLAADLWPRCQALAKRRRGGPSEKRLAMLNKRKLALHKKFEPFRLERPKLSRIRAAELFMADDKNKRACEKAGFTQPKSFSQAMKEISSRTAN
jgi:hypothetical protein